MCIPILLKKYSKPAKHSIAIIVIVVSMNLFLNFSTHVYSISFLQKLSTLSLTQTVFLEITVLKEDFNMFRELKMYVLSQIKYIALNLLLFYEEHVDAKHPVYKLGLAAEYTYMKNCVNNIEKHLSETIDKS